MSREVMTDPRQPSTLDTTAGPVRLRPEAAADQPLLLALFRSHTLVELAGLAMDDTARDALIRMQFTAQALTYRTNFAAARFDIVEFQNQDIGRIVVDAGTDVGCIVDFALFPELRRRGLGSAILAAVLQRFVPLARPVRCKVLMHNEPSIRMCGRVGFRQIDQIPPFVQLEWRPSP